MVNATMCLAIPAKVIDIFEEDGLLMAKVSFETINKKICISYTPEVNIGEYVLVHVGFSISILNEKEATSYLELLKEQELNYNEIVAEL